MKIKTFIVVLSLLFLSPIQAVFADDITVAAEPSWCPYICESGEKPGYMVEIAQAIFEANGHKFSYVNMPWAQAIAETRSGSIDGIIGVTDPKESPDFIFSDSLGEGADHFYGKKGEKWRYTGIKSLKLTRLGVVKDYVYGEAIDEYIADNQGTDAIKVASSERGLVQELMMGRVDVIISTNAVFTYSILDMKDTMDSFEDAGVLWASYGVYMGFSPASAKLEKSKLYAEIINKGISVLRDSGKLETIMNKYGLSDWE